MIPKPLAISIWSGPVSLLLFFSGLILSGFFPPHSPLMPQDQLIAMYREHSGAIKAGMAIQMFGSGFQIMFASALWQVMRRMDPDLRVFADAQFGAAAANTLLFLLPTMFWSVAAFRVDRDPQLVALFHDMGWTIFIVPFTLLFVQCLCVGLALVMQSASQPVLPRWLGYLSLWTALGVTPGAMALFFLNGPFAWNGILVFWLAATVFGIWYACVTWCLLKTGQGSGGA